jgi:hypothetical protein
VAVPATRDTEPAPAPQPLEVRESTRAKASPERESTRLNVNSPPTATDPAPRPSFGVMLAQIRESEPPPRATHSTRPPIAATLLSERTQEPTAQSPIWYRELAYAVPIGTEEAEAQSFALRMLASVDKQSLGKSPRFVNIAVFDEIFTGEPTIAPLAILEWKDWKQTPVTRFPRRIAAEPIRTSEPPRRLSKMPGSAADMFLGPATTPANGGRGRQSLRPRLTGDAPRPTPLQPGTSVSTSRSRRCRWLQDSFISSTKRPVSLCWHVHAARCLT